MLSVFLITRDEQSTLELTLRSVQPVADEIIVVDTGSRDRTVEIARACGALVHHFPWADDFSAARNFAASKIRGDWALCMDADEELLPQSHDLLRQSLARTDALGYTVRWQNLVHADQPNLFTEMRPLRILRRLDYVRFTGRIHEHLDPPIEKIIAREHKKIFPSDITLRHTGYVQEKKLAKLQRAARLLKLELHDRPGQVYYQIEYGRTLLQLGDPAGHAILADAARTIWALRDHPHPPFSLAAALLEYALSTHSLPPSNPLTPPAARYLAQRWFPDSPPLLWLLAQHNFAENDFTQAAQHLERLITSGQTGNYDSTLSFDPRILGEDALFNLAACHLRLAHLDQAQQLFEKLLTSPSRGPQAQQNLTLIQQLRNTK